MQLDPPVQVPQDAGAVLANADEDAVGLANKQAGDFPRVAVQVDLGFHLHLRRLLFIHREVGVISQKKQGRSVCIQFHTVGSTKVFFKYKYS